MSELLRLDTKIKKARRCRSCITMATRSAVFPAIATSAEDKVGTMLLLGHISKWIAKMSIRPSQARLETDHTRNERALESDCSLSGRSSSSPRFRVGEKGIRAVYYLLYVGYGPPKPSMAVR